ncbi:MAG: hypothetical protein IPK50_06365 [Fibrobacterota bacterium]|nr:hypothetical protein [Fibrobacterota bacterium]QQS06515.1 MAG: hypothetical protein IPK50_06365 [Fibrobacterota bacterium]
MNPDPRDLLIKKLMRNQLALMVLFFVWGIIGIMLFGGTVYFGSTWNYDVFGIAKDYFTYSLETSPSVPEVLSIIIQGIVASSVIIIASLSGSIVYLTIYIQSKKDIKRLV